MSINPRDHQASRTTSNPAPLFPPGLPLPTGQGIASGLNHNQPQNGHLNGLVNHTQAASAAQAYLRAQLYGSNGGGVPDSANQGHFQPGHAIQQATQYGYPGPGTQSIAHHQNLNGFPPGQAFTPPGMLPQIPNQPSSQFYAPQPQNGTPHALPPAVQLGHPATMAYPSTIQSSFHHVMALPSGLPAQMTGPDMASMRMQVNQTRRDAIDRHFPVDPPPSRKKVRRNQRGAAHSVPVMNTMPTMSVTRVSRAEAKSVNVMWMLYPEVAIPGEKRRNNDPILHVNRGDEFRQHLLQFGAAHEFMNLDTSMRLVDFFREIRTIMERGPFRYKFVDLEQILSRATQINPSDEWGQLAFTILVPGNHVNRRTSTKCFHLKESEAFEDLTLRGLLQHEKVTRAPDHFSWKGNSFIIRCLSRVPFTARAHTAFPCDHRPKRDQHECVIQRMMHLFDTDNPAEITTGHRSRVALPYNYDDPELSSSDEGREKARRRQNGEPVFSSLMEFPEDLIASDDEKRTPTAASTARSAIIHPAADASDDEVMEYFPSLVANPGPPASPLTELNRGPRQTQRPGQTMVDATPSTSGNSARLVTAETWPSTQPVHISSSIITPSHYTMPASRENRLVVASTQPHDVIARSITPPRPTLEAETHAPFILFPGLHLNPKTSILTQVMTISEFTALVHVSAGNPQYPEQGGNIPAANIATDMLDLSAPSMGELVDELETALGKAFKARDFSSFLSPHRLVSVNEVGHPAMAIGDGVLREAMDRLFERYAGTRERYFTISRGEFYTVATSGVSHLQKRRETQSGVLGALVGLLIAVNGRAPPRFSPLHFLFAATGGQLAALTTSFIGKYDPGLLEIMKRLRAYGPHGDLTAPQWLEYWLTYVGCHPNTLDPIPTGDEAKSWEEWHSREEQFARGLSFGMDTPEFEAFNAGLSLPCKNGFNLFEAVHALEGGCEAFIHAAWAPSMIDYDRLAPHLKFDLRLKAVTARDYLDMFQTARAFPPDHDLPDTDRLARELLCQFLEGAFRSALQTPPSRFGSLIRKASERGNFKHPPSSEELASDSYIVRRFHQACTGSTNLLGQGLERIQVIFVDGTDSNASRNGTPEFAACQNLVYIPVPKIVELLKTPPRQGSRMIKSSKDLFDWWLLESCIGSAEGFNKL